MDGDTLQKKVEMIEKIFAQTKDSKLRHALLEEVVSSRVEPVKVRSSSVNSFPKKRPDIKKTRKSVSKIRKFICALLLPVEIICEIMVNRPWLALFTIFGVILFIGKFISARAAGIMAFSLMVTFGLMGREEGSQTKSPDNKEVFDNDPNLVYPTGFYARRLTIPADPYRNF